MDGQTERRIKDFLEKIPSGVKVVAATKCRSIELVSECPAHGIFAAGENRVQELLSKYQPVEGLEWHFIGQLQTNKVKYILDKVSLIQSLDRVSLADKLEEVKTICWCGKKAAFNARFDGQGRGVKEGEQVVLGANDQYIGLCRKHWMAGDLGPDFHPEDLL